MMIREKGTGERYKSKAAMQKHEKSEPKRERMREGDKMPKSAKGKK